MSLLEFLAAKASSGIVTAVSGCWRDCPRCGRLRWRLHRHEQLPLAVVLELSSWPAQRARRDGGDVA